jgi:acyl dehydratase
MSAFARIAVGDIHDYGAHTFTAADIKAFARAFDPQPFHIDEAAAAESQFGGLVASGWHTAAIMMKLRVAYLSREIDAAAARGESAIQFGPSPGFDDLKWLRPVYAGDTISFVDRVTAKRESRSRPGWGIITMATSGTNQKGEAVFSIVGHIFAATGDG